MEGYNKTKLSRCMSKDYSNGPFAWLNDIEVCKIAYLLSFPLMVLNLILVRQPFFEIVVPRVETMRYTLHEVGYLSVLEAGVLIVGGASLLLLFIPMMKSFEWRYRWILPACLTSAVECAAVMYLNFKKNELVNETLIGSVYRFLSIEARLTASMWALLVINLLIFLCTIKMMYDIRSNFIKYQLPLMQM